MKKVILFIISLAVVGTLAYFGGYYLYVSENPRKEPVEQITLQRSALQQNFPKEETVSEYYLAKIEQDMLMIYKMPEETIYDSVKTSSLNFHGAEEAELLKGISFKSLPEVFEFLESTMS